jgi:putative Mg2+ transporter-C (MgtC) family protein
MMLATHDIVWRLIVAAIAGSALGLDRELRHKPAGLRTLGLVSLGSALLTLTGAELAASVQGDSIRVIQGIVTGIGFLGAGAILQRQRDSSIHGLTTAAAIWVAAAVGIGFGLGLWVVASTGLGLALLLLSATRPFERWLHRQAPPRPPH